MRMAPLRPSLAVAAIVVTGLALGGCSSSSSTPAASSSGAAQSAVASASALANASLGQLCPQIDAIMNGNPDTDAAATAASLKEIEAQADPQAQALVGALSTAYSAAAANPQATEAVSKAASALGAACESATHAPQ